MAKETKKDAEVVEHAELLKKTADEGNAILPLSAEQKKAYADEVAAVRDKLTTAGRQAIIARWHIGRTIKKLQDDAAKGGSTYGKATVEGFAHDVGFSRSVVYKCAKLAERLTLAEVNKLPLTVDAADKLFAATPGVQQAVIDVIKEKVDDAPDYRPSTNEVSGMIEEQVTKASETAAGTTGATTKAEKRASQFGTNSATGGNHKQVINRFNKSLEHVQNAVPNFLISIKEIPNDKDVSDKAHTTLASMQQEAFTEIDLAIKLLQDLKGTVKTAVVDSGKKVKDLEAQEKAEAKAKAKEAQEKEKAKIAAAKAKEKEKEKKRAAAAAAKKKAASKKVAKKSSKKAASKKVAKKSSKKSSKKAAPEQRPGADDGPTSSKSSVVSGKT